MRPLVSALLLLAVLGGCGSNATERAPGARVTQVPHIHGLGVDGGDGTLFVASHGGLFSATPKARRLVVVGRLRDDATGFTVIGPDRLLASGHPGAGTSGRPGLGLIQSRDAGANWRRVGLPGRADFHVLRAGPGVFYAAEGGNRRLFAGTIGSSRLARRTPPAGTLIDLAVDPRDEARVFATTGRGLFLSRDGARTWKRLDRTRTGLMAFWRDALTLVDGRGRVWRLPRLGSPWRPVGVLPDAPLALAGGAGKLFAAAGDGSILQSDDGGRTWQLRIA